MGGKVRPGNKLHEGAKVIFGDGLLRAEILSTLEDGTRKVKFYYDGIFNEILDKIGLMPLPPYIHESLSDNDRYQQYMQNRMFCSSTYSWLHFTPEHFKKELKKKDNKIA